MTLVCAGRAGRIGTPWSSVHVELQHDVPRLLRKQERVLSGIAFNSMHSVKLFHNCVAVFSGGALFPRHVYL